MKRRATVGVVEQANAAVLVTLGPDGALLDRRRVELTEPGLSTHPHHHEGSWAMGRYLNSPWAKKTSLAEAVALVKRVRASAERGAKTHLRALASSVEVPIGRIALRECLALPDTIEARIADNRAQTVADSVMYREALAAAARDLGWSVHWYDRDDVLDRSGVARVLSAMGKKAGPPWQATHKLSAAAALSLIHD